MEGRIEVWRDCAQWLTRCGALREDHKANWPNSVASDLAMTLRDGVLLCSLLIKIDPTCIDSKDVNQKPRMAQFLCLRNIRSFLQACHDSFGLANSDLFEPQCLFDLTDFLKVLQTLSKLSQCFKFHQKEIRGFSCQKPRSSEDDVYKDLSRREGAGFVNAAVEPEEYSSLHVQKRNEEIYQDLFSISRRSHTQPSAHAVNFVEKRDYIINELVETEQKYVGVLGNLQKLFMEPLSKILTPEDCKAIFYGIEDIGVIHTAFYAELRRAVTPGSKHRLSDVFLTSRDKFLVYGDYLSNLTIAKIKIAEMYNRADAFREELLKCEGSYGRNFKLRDILTIPMQRILKYELLLKNLVAETQMNFEDYRGLERAREAMVDVAQYLNEINRDSDALACSANVERTLIGLPTWINIIEYGRYKFDGELKIKAHQDDQKQKLRTVFIFDMAIVISKALKCGQYQYKNHLKLAEYKIEDHDSGKKMTLTREGRWCHQWYLVHRAEQTAFTCCSRSESKKRDFMNAIREAIDNIEPYDARTNHHRFRIRTFDRGMTCTHCSKYLKGKIFQGYECDICHLVCHKSCLSNCGRCGTSAHPPLLPPRLPARSVTPVATTPPLAPDLVEELERYMWFVGDMGRERASSLLDKRENGTYLLRVRPQGKAQPNESVFSLSLKTDGRVKHMKVCEQMVDGTVMYHLSVHRYFKSVIELVTYYEKNCLGENFQGLTATLQWPYRELVVVAEFDFNPSEPNQLPLRTGRKIIVLSKEGDAKGWWRGTSVDENREGFFPKHYVREISDTTYNGA